MATRRKLRPYEAVVELPARRSLCRLPFPIPEASDESPAKPVYLVVEHEVEKPAYSLFKVDSAGSDGPGDGDGHSLRLPGHLARLHEAKHGMSFVAMHSHLGSWIVGVGGASGPSGSHSLIYDPKTSKEIRGPCLLGAKIQPILLSIRGKVYAMSRSPAVKPGDESNPWFEVLDPTLENSYLFLPGSSTWCGSWRSLPPPPCFPCRLTEMEYKDPPEVCVTSYSVVDSHILLSLNYGYGTYAFDVKDEVWEQVQYKNLPFIGQAVPVVGRLFVSHSEKTNALTFYEMMVHPAIGQTGRMLHIIELPVVASEPIAPCQFFCSLGKGGSFCSFSIPSIDPGKEAKPDHATIVRCNYLMEDATIFGTEPEVVMAKQWRQVYEVLDRSRQLACPTPLVAALTLDTE